MNIPQENFRVKVGPLYFSVIYSKEVATEGQLFGCTNCNDQKIFLDPDRPRQKQLNTFLHELFHACMFVSGMTYRFDTKDRDRQPTEEDVVRDLSMVFHQVLQDNPTIFQENYDPTAS